MIIEDAHEGFFGTHANGNEIENKILRACHYWLSMGADCFSHVKRRHKCQIYVDNIHVPPVS